jgi:DNA adenine methylase
MQYIGGKSKFKNQLIKLMEPWNYDIYFEPFAGGMNVISSVVHAHRYANDNNTYLISLWKSIQEGRIPQRISKTQYELIKLNPDHYPAHIVAEAGFLASFKGLWFGGYNGAATNGRDYNGEMIRNVLRQAEGMKGVILSCLPYQELDIPDGALVYCDPPYRGTKNYHSGQFDSDSFWDWARELSSRCTVYVSEFNAPSDFNCVHSFERKNHMNYGRTENVIERVFRC